MPTASTDQPDHGSRHQQAWSGCRNTHTSDHAPTDLNTSAAPPASGHAAGAPYRGRAWHTDLTSVDVGVRRIGPVGATSSTDARHEPLRQFARMDCTGSVCDTAAIEVSCCADRNSRAADTCIPTHPSCIVAELAAGVARSCNAQRAMVISPTACMTQARCSTQADTAQTGAISRSAQTGWFRHDSVCPLPVGATAVRVQCCVAPRDAARLRWRTRSGLEGDGVPARLLARNDPEGR